ncbi:MAG: DUF3501 family protein, partial [Planctomycetes bacterium]|nr:DUF3501 family protein [Planctomycetota bacterium]
MENRSRTSRRVSLAARFPLWIAPLGSLLWILTASAAQGQTIWEITPYRIQVLVALEQSSPLTPRLQQDVLRELQQRSDRVIGAVWQLQAQAAPEKLRRQIIDDLAGIDYHQLLEHWPRLESVDNAVPVDQEEPVDKVVLLALATTPDGYRVAARELDVRTRAWGALVEHRFGQAPLIVGQAFQALLGAFTPLAKITSTKGDVAVVQFLAGGLSFRDPALRLVALGDVLQPIIRRNDRQGNPLAKRGIEPIAWTYLTVARFAGTEVHCNIHSGRRGVLRARTRGHTERLALVVRPRSGSTKLQLRANDSPTTPLAGYDVYASQPHSIVSLLLSRGWLTPEQIDTLEQFARQYPQQAIGHVAVAGKLITAEQLSLAIDSLQEGVARGDHLLSLELVGKDQVQRLLRDHAGRPEAELPQLAISRGWLTAAQFTEVRARQTATELVGRSDDDGNLTLSIRQHPLQILYIKHGGALLARLGGVEETAFIRIGGETIRGIPEADLDRTSAAGKASSVQFIHFPFTDAQVAAFRGEEADGGGDAAEVVVGFGHPESAHTAVLPEAVRQALAQ